MGLGATFALVREGVPPDRLARGFASTEVFRRVGYLIGPVVASGVLAVHSEFITGFQFLLVLAIVISLLATYGQFKGYRVAEEYEIFTNDSRSTQKGTLTQLYEDVQVLPVSLKTSTGRRHPGSLCQRHGVRFLCSGYYSIP